MSTIKQVAQRTGLSVSCVSKYLNHPDQVLPETKAKIDEAIKELDYHPSLIARSLRSRKTGIIAVVTESIVNPFFAELFEYLRRAFQKAGCKAILQTFSEREPTVDDFSFADGIVICFPDDEGIVEKIDAVSRRTPKVLIHGHRIEKIKNCVLCDIGAGSRLAVEHLFNKGCRNFLLVCGSDNSSMSVEKTGAILNYLKSTGEKTFCTSVFGPNDHFGGEAAVNGMTEILDRIDGVICESDALATGVVSRLVSLGYSVPDRIKVAGFDDIPIAHMFRPALTTVSIPTRAMCEEAVKMTSSVLSGEDRPVAVFSPELIVRETT
ncbi:MAG: LacI family DNA-binding transcriptional regulator [Clostridia bacterium]|nr:LacI family DNA-binding transcriptional regulator [Clostridia bacterium]